MKSFFRRFFRIDIRLTASILGLLVQVGAWACGIIAVFFLASKMPSLFQRIPQEILFACELLVVLAAGLLFRLLVERRRTLGALAKLSDALARFRPANREERVYGVSPEKMDRVRTACEYLTGVPRDWWQSVDDALEYYESPEGDGGWFLTRPVREILPEEEMIEPFYHSSFHQAVPGILTALGLLATFSAILVALSGVSYNAANTTQPVTGIDSLINGLAGKFLSSIIALLLSMIFTFVEKKVCERRIYRDVDSLRSLITRVFPFLSQTRILLDLQRIALDSRVHAVVAPIEPLSNGAPSVSESVSSIPSPAEATTEIAAEPVELAVETAIPAPPPELLAEPVEESPIPTHAEPAALLPRNCCTCRNSRRTGGRDPDPPETEPATPVPDAPSVPLPAEIAGQPAEAAQTIAANQEEGDSLAAQFGI